MPPQEAPPDLIPLYVAAKQLGVHLSTAYRWVVAGELRAWKRVGRLFVSKQEIADLYRPVPVPPHPETWTERRRRERQAKRETMARLGIDTDGGNGRKPA